MISSFHPGALGLSVDACQLIGCVLSRLGRLPLSPSSALPLVRFPRMMLLSSPCAASWLVCVSLALGLRLPGVLLGFPVLPALALRFASLRFAITPFLFLVVKRNYAPGREKAKEKRFRLPPPKQALATVHPPPTRPKRFFALIFCFFSLVYHTVVYPEMNLVDKSSCKKRYNFSALID